MLQQIPTKDNPNQNHSHDSISKIIIDKASTSFIAYVDDNGYPITKAMLKPREI